jgi:hypothetical protein
MTLLIVYGFADLIYVRGVLDFLHIPGLEGHKALCWMTPVICFSVVCGLALDYDVFLVGIHPFLPACLALALLSCSSTRRRRHCR